jgi:menaquinone-dependent protoporphyrinogen IX oxidase
MKILIAFASKGGTTERYANAIADVLNKRGVEVDIADLRKESPNLEKYGTVIVGTGVRAGKMYKEALNFIAIASGRRLGFFVSTLEPKGEAMKKYVDSLEVKPFFAGVLGGRFKLLWKVVADKTDLEAARDWAEELAEKMRP